MQPICLRGIKKSCMINDSLSNFLVGMRLLICPYPNERILTLLVDQDINSIPACLQMPCPALCFVDKAADSLISFLLFSVRCHYSHFSSARVLSIVTSLLKNISVIQSANTLIFLCNVGRWAK
jgi:hypothetical protein